MNGDDVRERNRRGEFPSRWAGSIWVALALGCAHHAGPPTPAGAATAAAPAAPEPEPPLPAFPTLPPAPPPVDHPEARALKIVARDVSRGFETLVATTGSDVTSESYASLGAEVRVEGASDERRPWSIWLPRPFGSVSEKLRQGTEGYLVVRRPLPPTGEHQTATIFIPRAGRTAAQRYRFALPDVDPSAHDPRALAVWVEALDEHIGHGTAWGAFAVARARRLYDPPSMPPAVAGPAQTGKRAKGKHGKATKADAPAAPHPRSPTGPLVTGPRRDSSDLARLMDTTTGVASLQETLQTDRGLSVRGDEPASVPFADAKPLELAAHPWGAMLAALKRTGPPEALASAVPADFYFVRFRTFADLFHLRDRLETDLGPALTAFDSRLADYDLRGRYEAQLGVGESALTRLLGPSMVRDMAIVGSDPYLREGSDLTLIVRVRTPAAFDPALAATLAANGLAHGGLTTSTVDRSGVTVTIARSADGVVRQHRARVGEFDVISNSDGAISRVLAAIAHREPALADEPDFRYMLARDPDVQSDVLAFLSDRFVASVIGPRQKILEARRQLALAELSPPGWAALLYGWLYGRRPASIDEILESGLLMREELSHANGEPIVWSPGRGARSSWGAVGALTPLIDLPTPAKITPRERDAYRIFTSGYQSYWRAYLDPVAVRFNLGDAVPGGPFSAEVRVLPIISGTEYTDLAREVGSARVKLDEGRRGVRTVIGLGPDAELRKLLSESSAELPLVGRLAFDWLGNWALLGIDDSWPKRPPPAPAEMARHQRDFLYDLIELPVYAGVEVRNGAGAAVFMGAVRHEIESAAPGVVDWREAGKERDVSFVAIRQKGEEATVPVALYYAFCKDEFVFSFAESALRRRIDECLDGQVPRGATATNDRAPQWIVETDWRERGPIWWQLASLLTRGVYDGHWDGSRRLAEAVIRGAPAAAAAERSSIAIATFGESPLDAQGEPFRLTDEGVQDPLRNLGDKVPPLLRMAGGPTTPYARLARALAHARSEVSFDDEPDVKGSPHARSLHVKLRLGDGDH